MGNELKEIVRILEDFGDGYEVVFADKLENGEWTLRVKKLPAKESKDGNDN